MWGTVRHWSHIVVTGLCHSEAALSWSGRQGWWGSVMVREPEELVEVRRVLGAQLAAFRRVSRQATGRLRTVDGRSSGA